MIPQTDSGILITYKVWADAIFYRAMSGLTDEELRQDRPMLFHNIFSLLNHIYAMDVVWKSHLEGKAHDFQSRNPQSLSSFSDLRDEHVRVDRWYQNYVEDLSAEQLGERVNFTFIGGGDGNMSRSEILQHVVNHGSYHRGHIEGVLYQMSIEPPTTDFPVFLREIREWKDQ